MSNLKEILQQIKDDYAKEKGYTSWKELSFDCATYGYKVEDHMTEICKRYAEEVIKEASERAGIQIEGEGEIMKNLKLGDININPDEIGKMKIRPDKQSILNLIDEL